MRVSVAWSVVQTPDVESKIPGSSSTIITRAIGNAVIPSSNSSTTLVSWICNGIYRSPNWHNSAKYIGAATIVIFYYLLLFSLYFSDLKFSLTIQMFLFCKKVGFCISAAISVGES